MKKIALGVMGQDWLVRIFSIAANGSAAWRGAGLSALKPIRITKLKIQKNMSNEATNPASCQTAVRRRAEINQEIAQKWELIDQIKSEIIALKKENLLLCDESQRFEETEEEVIISRRPKKTEKRLIGRVLWKEEFKDESTGQSIWIERSRVVRVNGVWQ